jgi:hypothetical protein
VILPSPYGQGGHRHRRNYEENSQGVKRLESRRAAKSCPRVVPFSKLLLNRIELTLIRKNLYGIAVPSAAKVFLAESLECTRGRISYHHRVLVDLVEHHVVDTLVFGSF